MTWGAAPYYHAVMAGIRDRAPGRGLSTGPAAGLAPGPAWWGWLGPVLVTVFGGLLRFGNLRTPFALVFDESYYVPDAYAILRYGAEQNVSSQAASILLGGGQPTGLFLPGGEFAAHPPFGKMQIAVGEWLFGLDPFGWRFATAVAGTLSILLLARIARRLTGSTWLGCAAGLLLALDGLEFVMSRTAMLDIFVMFWSLASFGCLLIDRDRTRDRLAAQPGAPLGIRWWRIAAGVCLGLAVSSKWNGLYYLAGFVPLVMAWDWGARRAAGPGRPRAATVLRDGIVTLASLWLAAAVAYLVTWTGWFVSVDGYDRHYAATHGVRIPVISALYSLYAYQRHMLAYGLGLRASQTFQSQPWTWLGLKQPVRFYYAAPPYGVLGCHVLSGCVQDVLAVGTPVLWWATLPALAILAVWWIVRRDWRAAAVLVAAGAGWLPWFVLAARPQFSYYAVSFEPFLILALVLCAGLLTGPPGAGTLRRASGTVITLAFLAAVAVNFFYLYPVLSGQAISHAAWLARMWWPNWV